MTQNRLFETILANFIPDRIIGAFKATVTIEEVATDDLEITSHPVQQGANITDHAFNKPSLVDIRILYNAEPSKLAETYAQLLKLKQDRIPMQVVTGKRTYPNMLMKSLQQINDSVTESALQINFSLQEIFITSLQVVSVAPRAKQADAGKTGATENAGKKTVQEAGENEQVQTTSILSDIFG
ncbi:MAG: hypothetical protein KAS30_01515 [Candidatus Diapherotrites archaeon]|nr:hypothetical protein [Candidatus Diapherotrites archaeon]